MADANGRDLTQFERWYTQAGTPTVKAAGAYDAATKTYALELSQSTPATPGQPTKLPLHIPVKIKLLDEKGKVADPIRALFSTWGVSLYVRGERYDRSFGRCGAPGRAPGGGFGRPPSPVFFLRDQSRVLRFGGAGLPHA